MELTLFLLLILVVLVLRFTPIGRLLILLVLGLTFFQCFRKKKDASNIDHWLEQHFPGRYVVLSTQIVDPIRNLSFKKKSSVIADKTDTLLQVQVTWDKRDVGLGLDAAEIENQFSNAKQTLADTRSLRDALQAGGVEKTSVCFRHDLAIVMFFEEPTPAKRKECLAALKKVFDTWPLARQYGLSVQILEPAAFGTRFADIIPLEHWEISDGWHRKQLIFSLDERTPGYDFDVARLNRTWKFNTDSERSSKFTNEARKIAVEWAALHLKKPKATVSATQCWVDSNADVLELEFPFTYDDPPGESPGVHGHVLGNYNMITGKLEDIRVKTDTE